MATSVFPTPVGPKMATTVGTRGPEGIVVCVHIGTGLSTSPDPRTGALEAAMAARAGLDGRGCDLAIVFASGSHLITPEAVLEAVDEALAPGELVGCAAGGVIGARREVEQGAAVSVW